MDNDNLKQTYFDELVTNKNMQLTKAVIPFLDRKIGSIIAIYIKIIELQNAVKIANSPNDLFNNKDSSIIDILKPFLGEENLEMLDMLMMLMNELNNENQSGDFTDILNNIKDIF